MVAVMDGDMQHDERLLARMFDAIQNQGYEVAIGSRHVEGVITAALPMHGGCSCPMRASALPSISCRCGSVTR
ncbi:hypothetical protein RAA17_03335 [Komagataeibacter rhaeticus]|nr:hypothetical protein [Komagataeibacter rhaeticus]